MPAEDLHTRLLQIFKSLNEKYENRFVFEVSGETRFHIIAYLEAKNNAQYGMSRSFYKVPYPSDANLQKRMSNMMDLILYYEKNNLKIELDKNNETRPPDKASETSST